MKTGSTAQMAQARIGSGDPIPAWSVLERALTPLLVVLVVTAFGLVLAWSTKPVSDPYAELRSFDPQIGNRLALPGSAVHRIEGQRWVLVYAGDCSSCSAHSLDLKSLAESAHRPILIVAKSPRSDWPASWKTAGVEVIQDRDNSIAQHLNALWTPRVYLIGLGARIEWISPKPGSLPESHS